MVAVFAAQRMDEPIGAAISATLHECRDPLVPKADVRGLAAIFDREENPGNPLRQPSGTGSTVP